MAAPMPPREHTDTSGQAAAGPFSPLRRHLALVIAAKLALLALLYVLFFSPAQRPQVDAGRAADRILAPR